MTGTDRGQLILVSGAVVGVAVASLVVLTLQLGAHPDVAPTAEPDVADTLAVLERGVAVAGNAVAGEYTWAERMAAATAANGTLAPYLTSVEHNATAVDALTTVAMNDSAARRWARTDCPRGPGRRFGACVATDGFVLQERAGEAHLVAAAVDLRAVDHTGRTELTVVLRVAAPAGPV